MTDRAVLRVDRVRARMRALGLDQLRLAERTDMTSGAISRLLSSGGGHVSSLKALAEALDCSADYLLGLVDDPTPSAVEVNVGDIAPEVLSLLRGRSLDFQLHLVKLAEAATSFPPGNDGARGPSSQRLATVAAR